MTVTTSKLKVNSLIQIVGFPMLHGLINGDIRKVIKINDYHGRLTYNFSSKQGNKILCRFYVDDVDAMINNVDKGDQNGIKIIKE